MYCSAVSKFGVDDAVFVWTYILRSTKVYRKCLEHTPERGRRVLRFHTAAPKVGPRARACAHTRPSPAGCWGEASRAWVGWANSLTGGGQNKVQRWPNKVDLRAEWPLQGIPSEKVASGRCSPISTNLVALFGLSCTRSTLHLALAIFQQGAPCFGHCPFFFFFNAPDQQYTAVVNMRPSKSWRLTVFEFWMVYTYYVSALIVSVITLALLYNSSHIRRDTTYVVATSFA